MPPTNSKTASKTGPLCGRCKKTDFRGAVQKCRTSTPQVVLSIGSLDELRSSNCRFCQLLFKVACAESGSQRKGSIRRYHVRSFPETDLGGLAGIGCRMLNTARVLGVCEGPRTQLNLAQRRQCRTLGFVGPVLEPGHNRFERKYRIQEVQEWQVNYSKIRSWISACFEKHPGCRHPRQANLPPKMVCLDVTSSPLEIKPIDCGDEYLALSYVWEEATRSVEDTVNNGSEQASLAYDKVIRVKEVIQDAVGITVQLGFRYLWVDEFCVDQKDRTLQAMQLQCMDRVYENATATIIASPERKSEVGIPGVGRKRKSTSLVIEHGGFSWTSSLPHLSTVVARSTWVTRAWTYQEAVLSRRCIFFTEEQVYFLCQGGAACESITSPNVFESHGAYSFKTYALETDLRATSKGTSAALLAFFADLYNYKSRQLTKPEDSLNAFRGILARSVYPNLWGIPVACPTTRSEDQTGSSLAMGFVRGLWWDNPGHPLLRPSSAGKKYGTLVRRSEFPSWSWAGWAGPLRPLTDYANADGGRDCNEVEEISFDIEFQVVPQSGSPLTLADALALSRSAGSVPKVLLVHTSIFRVRIRRSRSCSNPIAYICACRFQVERCTKQENGHIISTVRLFKDPQNDPHLSWSLFRKTWHAIPLFTLKNPYSQYGIVSTLLVDWDENLERNADVIGNTCIEKSHFTTGAIEYSGRTQVRLS